MFFSKESEREKAILNLLWEMNTSLSSTEIFVLLKDEMENITYVHRAINDLKKRGLIYVTGREKVNTQYIRKFACAMSREEYAAKIVRTFSGEKVLIGKVALALLKEDSKDSEKSKDVLISQLEAIIDEIKSEDDMDADKN